MIDEEIQAALEDMRIRTAMNELMFEEFYRTFAPKEEHEQHLKHYERTDTKTS